MEPRENATCQKKIMKNFPQTASLIIAVWTFISCFNSENAFGQAMLTQKIVLLQ